MTDFTTDRIVEHLRGWGCSVSPERYERIKSIIAADREARERGFDPKEKMPEAGLSVLVKTTSYEDGKQLQLDSWDGQQWELAYDQEVEIIRWWSLPAAEKHARRERDYRSQVDLNLVEKCGLCGESLEGTTRKNIAVHCVCPRPPGYSGQPLADGEQQEVEQASQLMDDLIASNQEQVLRKYREGLVRIMNHVRKSDMEMVEKIYRAVQMFHPMHAESWQGWPDDPAVPEEK